MASDPRSSSLNAQKMCLRIIEDSFGVMVKSVAHYLVQRAGATLSELRKYFQEHPLPDNTLITSQELKDSLLILIQHNFIEVKMPTEDEMQKTAPRVILTYILKVEEVCLRIRFPWFCLRIKGMFGDLGVAILQQLSTHGRMTLQHAKDAVAADLSNNNEEEDDLHFTKDQEKNIQKVFEEMIQKRYIVKVNPLDLTNPSPPPDTAPISASRLALQKSLFGPPVKDTSRSKKTKSEDGKHGQVRVRKRKANFMDEAPPKEDSIPLELQLMLKQEEMVQPNRKVKLEHDIKLEPTDDMQLVGEDNSKKKPRKRNHRRGRGKGRGDRGRNSNGNKTSSPEPASVTLAVDVDRAILKAWEGNVMSGAVWRIGTDQFMRDFRHAACEKLAGQKLNNVAKIILSTMLKMSAPTERSATEDVSTPITANALHKEVPKKEKLDWGMLTKYLELLRMDNVKFISKVASGFMGGGQDAQYVVNMGNMLRFLRQRAVHSMLEDKFGLLSARIFFILLDKKYLEDTQIGELAMVPARECRERVCRMYRERFLSLQEVPKRGDHNPNSTFYLWTVDPVQVQNAVLDKLYHSLLNLTLRRAHEVEQNKELMANVDKITDSVEAEKFEKVSRSLDRLDQAIHKIDETIMLFTSC